MLPIGSSSASFVRSIHNLGANDNALSNSDADIAPWQRLDRVVFDIARLIGRQMAREDFERLQSSTTNDNALRKNTDDQPDGEGEAEED